MASRRLTVVLDLDSGRYSGRMRSAASVTKTLQGRVDQTSKSMRGMGNSFDRTGRQMSTPLQKLRDYVLILGNVRLAILNVRDIAVGWVSVLVKQSAEVQRLTVLMKGLSSAATEFGRNKEAHENLQELFALSRGSGIAVQSLADSFVKMKSAGVDPTNGSLRSLVDAVSAFGGTSDTFHRASIAIQQMAGKGVISMEELRQQLGEAVPTAMFDMARAMNMSVGELVKAVSDGKVEAAPALQALFEEFELKYAGAGKRLAETFNGQMAIMKTNMLDLSNSFTGLNRNAEMINLVNKEFAEGKIDVEQYRTEIAALKADAQSGSLFGTLATNLKAINEAMQSTEAKQFMAELGQSIGTIANAVAGVIRWIIEWRNEIGALVQVVASGFALITAQRLIAYFFTLGTAGVQSLGNLTRATTAAQGPMQGLVNWGTKLNTQMRTRQAIAAGTVRSTQNQITSLNAKIAALQKESVQLNKLSSDWAKNAAIIDKHRAASAAALAQGKKTGVYRDFETKQFISQSRAIEINTNLNRLNIRNKQAAAVTSQKLAAAEAKLTAALTAQTAAQGRLGAATAATTVKKTLMTTATRVAGAAVRGFGMMVNFALGPVGIIIGLLYSAASAAGVFANSADRAADAARNMANGIYTLANAERFRERLAAIKREKGDLEQEIRSGKAGTRTLGHGPTGMNNAGLIGLSDSQIADRRARLARLEGEEERLLTNLGRNNEQVRAQTIQRYSAQVGEKIEIQRAAVSSQYQIGLTEIANNRQLSEAQKQQRVQALRSEHQAALRAVPEKAIRSLRTSLAGAITEYGENSVQANNIAELLNNVTESQNNASASFEAGVEPVNAYADGLGSVAPAANSASTSVAGTTRKLTEAEKAFKRFNDEIVRDLTKIAELEDELATGGANSEMAKLEARIANGRLALATDEQRARMLTNAARIDELRSQIDVADTMSELDREITKVEASAQALWSGYVNDAYDAAQATAAVEDRFADMIAGLTGPDLEAALAKIERIKQALRDEEAADIANEWNLAAEQITISLLNENLQRQRNFELEVERQRALIARTAEGTQKRKMMEEAFARWKKAKELELARANEGSTVKMARDWAKLGQNMDQALSGALSNLVDGLAEGKFAFDDFAVEIVKSLIKVILKAIIAYAILSALGMTPQASGGGNMSLGSFIKGGIGDFAGGLGGLGGTSEVPVNHKGGVLGNRGVTRNVDMSVFSGAPRFHDGGLLPGEIPIIGKEGEIILNEAQQSNVAASMKPNVQVNVINNGADADAEVSEPRFDGKQMIVDVVLESASKPGPMRDLLKSMK